MLIYFKCANFFIAQLGEAYRALGRTSPWPSIDVILPIGVSFFTFQCVAYIVDVYRGELKATRDLIGWPALSTISSCQSPAWIARRRARRRTLCRRSLQAADHGDHRPDGRR